MNTQVILKDLATGKVSWTSFIHSDADALSALIDPDKYLTLEEIVIIVIDEFTQQDKKDMVVMNEDELIVLHNQVGDDIRSGFGLWLPSNPYVLAHPVDTSMTILTMIWETLRTPESQSGSSVMEFK